MAKPGTRRDGALRRALDLLEKVPLVDGHNDLPWVIRRDPIARGDVLKYDLARRHNDGDTDIPRLRQGRVGGQIWAAYVPTDIEHPARSVLEQIDIILRINAAHPNVFLPATRAADIGRAKRTGKIASIMAVEGGVGLENSLSPLRVWHAAGARLMTLCHNGTLDWVDSATDAPRHGGLTEFGRAVVRELNRLGMIVDCAHVSPDVMRQVLEVSTAPIVFSHSNARGLCDHPRNVPDDVLELIKKNGGVVMVNFYSGFITPEGARLTRDMFQVGRDLKEKYPDEKEFQAAMEQYRKEHPIPTGSVHDVVDHIEHIIQVAGVDHVGLGSDFDGINSTPKQLEDVSCYPYITQELLNRGHSKEDIQKVLGLNILRVMREAEQTAKDWKK